jgi:phage-related minor tail protein
MNTGVMGEAGPEAIMPLSKGPGGRLGVDASGAGGGDISVTVNVDAKGTGVEGNQQQGAALGRVISAAVQAEIIKQQRPGGLLTR